MVFNKKILNEAEGNRKRQKKQSQKKRLSRLPKALPKPRSKERHNGQLLRLRIQEGNHFFQSPNVIGAAACLFSNF